MTKFFKYVGSSLKIDWGNMQAGYIARTLRIWNSSMLTAAISKRNVFSPILSSSLQLKANI